MSAIITINGTTYDVINTKLTRTFQVLDGDNTGRTMDGVMHRDLIGTFYNYIWEIEPDGQTQYDELYEIISSPVASINITVPYGQTTKTFDAYVTNGSDELQKRENGVNYWSGIKINFIAIEPNRTAV